MINTIEDLTEVAHGLHVRSCQLLGDQTHQPWMNCGTEERDSFSDGIDFLLANPGAGAKEMHAEWVDVRRAMGWMRGSPKSKALRVHPYLLPWAELPKHRRMQYAMLVALVREWQA